MKKRKNAFTFIELLIVVAILGLLLMIASPSFVQSRQFHQKNMVNTTNKVLISAINYWIKDNIDPSQRPSDFNSRNSQGKAVFEYISNREILSTKNSDGSYTGKSNLWIETIGDPKQNNRVIRTNAKPSDDRLDIQFEKGILTVGYFDGSTVKKEEKRYVVYPIINGDNGKPLSEEKSYESLKERNLIIESKTK